MFIQLPLGWMQHPFPTNSFRLHSAEQIGVLRELGVTFLSYIPSKSSLDVGRAEEGDRRQHDPRSGVSPPELSLPAPAPPVSAPRDCAGQYREAASAYEEVALAAQRQPMAARDRAQVLVKACVAELVAAQEGCVIRLLTDCQASSSTAHAVNVMVLALMLGRSLEFADQALEALGMAALLHDIGKTAMPAHIAEPGGPLVPTEMLRYRAHVGESVALGQQMDLSSDVLIAIAQHHEMSDGSGYPLRLVGDDLSRNGQILALVNSYDRLCNPLEGRSALTPHEAVAHLYAQQRACHEPSILAAFIRLMGVYPPGSLVQLVDGRFAQVTGVNAAHPLRPVVSVQRGEGADAGTLSIDLSAHRQLGIRRSVRPAQLPRAVLDALLPGSRICYYFERATPQTDEGGPE